MIASVTRFVGRARNAARGVLGASSPLVAGRLVSAALTFALPLVLARLLSPAAFGTYKQFFLIVSTVLLTGQLGLTQSLFYFLPRGGKERGAYIVQTFVSLFFIGAAFGAILFAGAPLLGRWLGDGTLATLRVPLALFGALSLVSAPLEGSLTSEGRIGAAGLAYVATDGVRAFALIVGAKYFGPAGIFWAATITGGLRVVALWALVFTRALPGARPDRALFKAQLAYALPFAGSTYLYVAQRYFAQYAVSASFDAATFALFAVASFHMPVVDIIFSPLSDVMMVHIGRAVHAGETRGAWVAWNDTVQKLAQLLFPAAACAWLFGPTVLPILFTHKYDGSVPLFMLATLEIPLWILPLDALLRAAGETRFLFKFNAARIAFTALFVIGGIKLFGLSGAIVGAIASEALSRLGMMARGRKFLGVGLAHVVDFGSLGRTAAAAAAACVPAYALRFVLPMRSLPSVVLAGAVYAGTYLVIRLVLARRARIALGAVGLAPEAG
jgi:O-antigen/teichoic acid export membrane protein